jgi:nodulation protein E
MRRVVVTGIGVISALGPDRTAFWQALCQGRPGIGPIRSVDRSLLRFENGAEVGDYNPADHFDAKTVMSLDRFAQFGVIAAREAVRDAQLEWTDELREQGAVVTGSCTGGQSYEDEGFVDLYVHKRNRVHPLTVPRVMANAGASHISTEFGITGSVYTISTACSSASHAIGHAFWLVRQGNAEVAIAGGSEAPFSFGNLKAWEAIRTVASDTCRPFSKNRSGLILGEGGAMLVLEPLDSAHARGAHVYGEIVGFGMSSDASHLTQTCPDGGVRAIRRALKDAGLVPEQIGYINAHGTGTAVNDPAETQAIRAVFNGHADCLQVSSTKSMHGHALGAAGALEAAASLLALRLGVLPPTANFTEPDPRCDLDVIPNEARERHVECALSNSFAFGGLNVVLAFRNRKNCLN